MYARIYGSNIIKSVTCFGCAVNEPVEIMCAVSDVLISRSALTPMLKAIHGSETIHMPEEWIDVQQLDNKIYIKPRSERGR